MFSAFLRESFDLLIDRRVDIFAAMCRPLRGKVVRIEVGRERVGLFFGDREVRFVGPYDPSITVVTDRNAILRVIDGRRSLSRAVVQDELRLIGSLKDLLAFHDSLLSYVQGAVRVPEFGALLQRFRQIPGGPERTEDGHDRH
jgi:ubiquinone biosynthesis protein UbiJ